MATYLRQTMTIEQSEARVLAMSAEEQSVYLGERTITKYGCFGCASSTLEIARLGNVDAPV